MAGVAASAALFSTAGCNSNNGRPCDDRNQPCDKQSSGYIGGAHGGGYIFSGSGSGHSGEGEAGHSSEGGSFGRSGGFGHGGGGEGGG
jgi:hypothetical protein